MDSKRIRPPYLDALNNLRITVLNNMLTMVDITKKWFVEAIDWSVIHTRYPSFYRAHSYADLDIVLYHRGKCINGQY